jgi:hypothetical protein
MIAWAINDGATLSYNHQAAALLLLEKGCSKDRRNQIEVTPLIEAAAGGAMPAVG